MTAAHYKGGHHPGNDLGLHYTALPPIVASCPYSDQLLVTRKFWSPGANRPSQVRALPDTRVPFAGYWLDYCAEVELATIDAHRAAEASADLECRFDEGLAGKTRRARLETRRCG